MSADPRPALTVEGLQVQYGPTHALFDVSLTLSAGGVLALLGANGAGKSTVARAVSGLVPLTSGKVTIGDTDITGWPAHRIRRTGLVHLPEGRGIFPALTVTENLRVAALTLPRAERRAIVGYAFDLFPELARRPRQAAGRLSGGEQQMLSLARALAVRPSVVVADELSLGLAPKIVDVVFDGLARISKAGASVLVIEQFVVRALGLADHCVILQRGRTSWAGPSEAADGEVMLSYLGAAAAGVA